MGIPGEAGAGWTWVFLWAYGMWTAGLTPLDRDGCAGHMPAMKLMEPWAWVRRFGEHMGSAIPSCLYRGAEQKVPSTQGLW